MQSCAVGILKSSEAPDYGFISMPELLKKNKTRAAFNKSWIADSKIYMKVKDNSKYIYIKPVNVDLLAKELSKEIDDQEELQHRIEEAQEVSDYFYHKLRLIINHSEDFPLELVDKPRENTLSLELAIVELVPTNVAINALGTIAGFFVPGGGLIKLTAKSKVAMEGLVKEKVLLEEFKDREGEKTSFFTVRDFQRYAHVRESVDDWSMQLVNLLSSPVKEELEDSSSFSFNPF